MPPCPPCLYYFIYDAMRFPVKFTIDHCQYKGQKPERRHASTFLRALLSPGLSHEYNRSWLLLP